MTLLLHGWLWTDVSTKGTDGIFHLDKEREACLLVKDDNVPILGVLGFLLVLSGIDRLFADGLYEHEADQGPGEGLDPRPLVLVLALRCLFGALSGFVKSQRPNLVLFSAPS
jgi:hypothetical protein